MTARRGRWLVLVALVIAGCTAAHRRMASIRPPVGPGELQALVPSAATFERRSQPVPHWEALPTSTSATPLARVLCSSDVCTTVGYGGPLDLLVAVDERGRLAGVVVRSHCETPAYAASLLDAGNLQRLVGDEAPVVARLDGVTGATVTARALQRALDASLDGLTGRRRTATDEGTERWVVGPVTLWAVFSGAAAWAGYWWASLRLRWLAIVGGATLGAAGVFVSFESCWPVLVDHRLPVDGTWCVLAVTALAAACWRGRLFCGMLCPLGAMQELVAMVRSRDGPGDATRWRGLRFVAAAGLLVAAGFVGQPSRFTPDPIFAALTLAAEPTAVTLVAVVLAGSLIVGRSWCRLVCPVGALLSSVAFAASPPVRMTTTPCTGCGRCVRTCPMGALGSGPTVRLDDCIMCGACMRGCPEGVLSPRGGAILPMQDVEGRSRFGLLLLILVVVFVAHGAVFTRAAVATPSVEAATAGPSWAERKRQYDERIRGRARLDLHEAQYYRSLESEVRR